jgi:hypothetical protein
MWSSKLVAIPYLLLALVTGWFIWKQYRQPDEYESATSAPKVWLSALAAILILGNIAVLYLVEAIMHSSGTVFANMYVWVAFVLAIPLFFLIVPVATLVIIRKGGMLRSDFTLHAPAGWLFSVGILVWLAVLYLFIMNFEPLVAGGA